MTIILVFLSVNIMVYKRKNGCNKYLTIASIFSVIGIVLALIGLAITLS
jgi:hypothetical protein